MAFKSHGDSPAVDIPSAIPMASFVQTAGYHDVLPYPLAPAPDLGLSTGLAGLGEQSGVGLPFAASRKGGAWVRALGRDKVAYGNVTA